jgi:plastocyanin
MNKILKVLIFAFIWFAQDIAVAAEKEFEVEIIIKDHKFIPEAIEVPAGKKVKLIVHNQDETVEEFESTDLKREKIIPGNSKVKIVLAPLKPGEYKFFGDFYPETAQGTIVSVEKSDN